MNELHKHISFKRNFREAQQLHDRHVYTSHSHSQSRIIADEKTHQSRNNSGANLKSYRILAILAILFLLPW